MSAAQPITSELRHWIVAQATAGHPPETVLDAMKASGWDEDIAIAAMESTLGEHLAGAPRAAAAEAGPAGARRRRSRRPPLRRAGDRDGAGADGAAQRRAWSSSATCSPTTNATS